MIEINDKKSIGRVLFIVEGSKTEFAILRKIFCDILKYEYIEKRRNRPDTFKSKNNRIKRDSPQKSRKESHLLRQITQNNLI